MKDITFFEVKPWEKVYLKKKLNNYNLKFFKEPLDKNNILLAKDSDIISTFIYSKVDKSLINNLPKLRLLATRSTGFDHINLQECKSRDIIICNVPYYGENTVAEHTFALILSLSRNVHKSYVRTLKDDFSIGGLTGFDLKGKTIGIVGGGHIGLHVAKMARGFGMKVIIYDTTKQNFLAEVIGFNYVTFEELLKNSDIISLHVPYNKQTHHLINKNNIMKVKKGAILINTARGSIVDTDALLYALEKKILGGAGLDVIEGEELIKEEDELLHKSTNQEKWRTVVRDHKIFMMDNVVFTPHNAFNSREASIRILDTTIENIKSYLNKNPINIVNS